jgi:hypothetical protein
MRPEIGLADLATAVTTLDATDETPARIARLLGLAPVEDRRSSTREETDAQIHVRAEQPAVADAPRDPGPDHTPGEAGGIANQPQLKLETTPLDRVAIDPPSGLKAAWPAPAGRAPAVAASRNIEPLLEPRLTMGILAGVIRTWHRDGAVDADAAAQLIARRRPMARVPRLFQSTLRMGVELLVDRGEGMALFEPDVEQLIATIRRLVGAAVSVRSFDESPLKSGSGPRRLWTTYEPPSRGTPVVALTDFGIVRPAATVIRDWLVLSRRLRLHGCPLIGFVPWPQKRHPPELRREIPMLVWDRATTVSSLRGLRERQRTLR